MENWEEEYHRRLRRVFGVTDDSRPVVVETRVEVDRYQTGCDTCGWGADTGTASIVVSIIGHGSKIAERSVSQEFELGELMRAILEVEDD